MRTDIDFSKHELSISKYETLSVYRLKVGNSQYDSFTFIIGEGITAVTGDYSNWIFCREFWPFKKEYVNEGYWCEKLQIASEQESHEFDGDLTVHLIDERIAEYEEDYEREMPEEEMEYLNRCKSMASSSQFEYESFAYLNSPSNYDSEHVIMGKKIKYHLLAVFDAFEEICKRLD